MSGNVPALIMFVKGMLDGMWFRLAGVALSQRAGAGGHQQQGVNVLPADFKGANCCRQ